MEMVAEGVLEATANLGSLKVNSTFTAVVEGKNVNEVSTNYYIFVSWIDCLFYDQIDNTFFLISSPIQQFSSQLLVCTFPRGNRIEVQTRDHLKKQLSK